MASYPLVLLIGLIVLITALLQSRSKLAAAGAPAGIERRPGVIGSYLVAWIVGAVVLDGLLVGRGRVDGTATVAAARFCAGAAGGRVLAGRARASAPGCGGGVAGVLCGASADSAGVVLRQVGGRWGKTLFKNSGTLGPLLRGRKAPVGQATDGTRQPCMARPARAGRVMLWRAGSPTSGVRPGRPYHNCGAAMHRAGMVLSSHWVMM